ncbi:MAG TPA: sugar ABC transporter permease [Actinopolymorphaceae bacterium]
MARPLGSTDQRLRPVHGGAPTAGRDRLTRRCRDALAAYAFISPAYVLFLVFLAGPLLGAIVLSLYSWQLLGSSEFIGLDNFRTLAQDDVALRSIGNTFVFTFWSVVLHIGLGLPLALAVNRAMPTILSYVLRASVFFPMLVSWAAVSLIWKYILDPNFGVINYYLERLGIAAPTFLVDPDWAMPALIVVDLWKTIGFTFIILLAGLQGIPSHLYDAARVDGASAVQRFWNVTLPMLSPTLFFATIITFIGAFQIFEPMFIMTGGGPKDSTLSIVMHIYETAFRRFEMGYASALALVVFVVIMIVTLVQLRLGRYWVHYE